MSRVVVKVLRPKPVPQLVALPAPEPARECLCERPMTRTQAAEWLGISVTELSRLTSGGQVPHLRVGASPRYLRHELLDYMRQNAQERSEGAA